MDAPDAHIDMIPWGEREAARHILCTSCLDQDRILTEGHGRCNGTYTRNSRHAHTQAFDGPRKRASFNFAFTQLGCIQGLFWQREGDILWSEKYLYALGTRGLFNSF